MTEIESKKEKRLKILGDLFGYLAIILGLLIPFFLDEIKKEDITQTDELFYIMSVELIFLILIGICSFFFFRYLGKDYIAETISIMLLGSFFLIVIMILHPLNSLMFSSVDSAFKTNDLNLLAIAVTTVALWITLIFIGSMYYVDAFSRLRARKKAQKEDPQ